MKFQHEMTPETRTAAASFAASARSITWGLALLGFCIVAAALIHKHVTVSHLKGA